VHFSHIGHALLGDDIYGEECEYISRHALHAYRLSIPIPYGDEIETFISSPPDDMKKAFFDINGLSLEDIFSQISKNP
jgi:23S rRNA pseudouridine1911/1915/1917 synthase